MLRTDTIVKEGTCGVLYEDGALSRILSPGRYRFWTWWWEPHRQIVTIDLRECSTTIRNQEILTSDKVAVRLSLLVYYKVTDARAALHNVEAYLERIYEDVQLAARRFLSTRTLDQILRDRNDISDAVREDVKASAQSYGVEIRRADVKDLAFPGNLREIMNKVIEAEREGEAKLLEATKRAEVARIEADAQARMTAQRMEADERSADLYHRHPHLLRLKELETLKEIGAKGGNHFYIGLGDPMPPMPATRKDARKEGK